MLVDTYFFSSPSRNWDRIFSVFREWAIPGALHTPENSCRFQTSIRLHDHNLDNDPKHLDISVTI